MRCLLYVPGVLSALQRCLLEAPSSIHDTLDHGLIIEVLILLEKTSLLLLGVLYGDVNVCATEKGNEAVRRSKSTTFHIYLCHRTVNFFFVIDAPPSFCDMGNAISSLIAQASEGGQADGEECVLLSEDHSLVLTCCWVSLKVRQNQTHQ